MIKTFLALGAFFMVVWSSVIFVIVGVFTFWTQSNLSFYITYFTDKPTEIDYWTSFLVSLVSLFIAGALLWANAIASVLRLFL